MGGGINHLFNFHPHRAISAGYWLTITSEFLLSSPPGETGFWTPHGVFPNAKTCRNGGTTVSTGVFSGNGAIST